MDRSQSSHPGKSLWNLLSCKCISLDKMNWGTKNWSTLDSIQFHMWYDSEHCHRGSEDCQCSSWWNLTCSKCPSHSSWMLNFSKPEHCCWTTGSDCSISCSVHIIQHLLDKTWALLIVYMYQQSNNTMSSDVLSIQSMATPLRYLPFKHWHLRQVNMDFALYAHVHSEVKWLPR